MLLHKFHRVSGLIIGLFVLSHIINHLFILGSVQQHIDFMHSLRAVYRSPIAETLLLICVLFQVCSGAYFAWRRRGQHSSYLVKAQIISGLYLAFFFLNHVGAVFFGRLVTELDTNIYYGIAGFYVTPFHLYFIPYYFFAIVSIFVHIACAFNGLGRNAIADRIRSKLVYTIIFIGVLISIILVAGFNGAFYEITIPQEYRAFYE